MTGSSPRKKILKSALKEFSRSGYSGARMETIARRAGVNKALLFYYFGSKENLYRLTLENITVKIFPRIAHLLKTETSPVELLEKLPALHMSFLNKNLDFVRIMAIDLVQNPKRIKKIFQEQFRNNQVLTYEKIYWRVKQWFQEGKISEPDPINFILNIISLSMFFFIATPIIEAMLEKDLSQNGDFLQKRLHSIINLLKKGMLK